MRFYILFLSILFFTDVLTEIIQIYPQNNFFEKNNWETSGSRFVEESFLRKLHVKSPCFEKNTARLIFTCECCGTIYLVIQI